MRKEKVADSKISGYTWTGLIFFEVTGPFWRFFFVSTRLLSKNSMDLREKADFKQSPFNIPLFYR